MRSVQEDGYVLGKIVTNTATTPRASSRSVLQSKLAALDMKVHTKDADVDVILFDLTKVDHNRNLTDNQYYIKFPSLVL